MSENDTYTVFDSETQQPLTVTVAPGGGDETHGTIQYITQDGVQIQQITQPGGEIVQVKKNYTKCFAWFSDKLLSLSLNIAYSGHLIMLLLNLVYFKKNFCLVA